MANLKNIFCIIVISFITISFSNLYSQDSIKQKERNYFRLFPSEIKYLGGTNFKEYHNGIYLSKTIVGITGRNGFSGDGFNKIYEFGISYTYQNRKNYLSVFPQIGGISWWGGHIFLKCEPQLNLNKLTFDYLNTEVGIGVIGSLSLFYWFPLNKNNTFITGFKVGFDIPNHIYLKERKN